MKIAVLVTANTAAHQRLASIPDPVFAHSAGEIRSRRDGIGQVCECAQFACQRPHDDNGFNAFSSQAGQDSEGALRIAGKCGIDELEYVESTAVGHRAANIIGGDFALPQNEP